MLSDGFIALEDEKKFLGNSPKSISAIAEKVEEDKKSISAIAEKVLYQEHIRRFTTR